MPQTKPKTAKKPATGKTPAKTSEDAALQALKLADSDLEFIAESYMDSGEDRYVISTIVLLRRLYDLSKMRDEAPLHIEDMIARMIDRLVLQDCRAEYSSEKFAIATSNKFGPTGGAL